MSPQGPAKGWVWAGRLLRGKGFCFMEASLRVGVRTSSKSPSPHLYMEELSQVGWKPWWSDPKTLPTFWGAESPGSHSVCSGSLAPGSFCLANSHLSIWVLIWLSPPLGSIPGFAHFGFCMSPLCLTPPGLGSLGNLCFHLGCRQLPQGSEGSVFPSALPHSSFLAGSIHSHRFADSPMLGKLQSWLRAGRAC